MRVIPAECNTFCLPQCNKVQAFQQLSKTLESQGSAVDLHSL